MADKVVYPARSNVHFEAEVFSHDNCVLYVPRRSALAHFGFPAHVAFFAAVPKDEVASVPWRYRVCVFVEAALSFRPLTHVKMCEFSETLKLRGFEVRVSPAFVHVPVRVAFLDQHFSQPS